MEARSLFVGWRGRQKSLSIFGKVLAAIWGIEALRQDYQRSALLSSFEDTAPSPGQIGRFIGAYTRVSWLQMDG